MKNDSNIRICDEKYTLVMLSNQNKPMRAHTFFLDLASYIQHKESIERIRNSLKMMFQSLPSFLLTSQCKKHTMKR